MAFVADNPTNDLLVCRSDDGLHWSDHSLVGQQGKSCHAIQTGEHTNCPANGVQVVPDGQQVLLPQHDVPGGQKMGGKPPSQQDDPCSKHLTPQSTSDEQHPRSLHVSPDGQHRLGPPRESPACPHATEFIAQQTPLIESAHLWSEEQQ